MTIDRPWIRPALAVFTLALASNQALLHAQKDLAATVESTHPLAYYRLDAPNGKSQVGLTTYKAIGGVTSASPGALINDPNNQFAQFNGQDGYILTTQKGGVGQTASFMAWINLAQLPSKAGHIFYVAGESEVGNDLDLQIEQDNVVKFFTAAGGEISFAPPAASMLNQWHMVAITLDTAGKSRAIYWDGKLANKDAGGGRSGKIAPFSVGASTVFGGRWFNGGIEQVALWNRALTSAEIASIYASRLTASSSNGGASATTAGGPTPSTGPFATTAKVEISDEHGAIKLNRDEEIAYMFLSAIEVIEHNCQLTLQRTCSMSQMLTGSYPPGGSNLEHLKFDPNKTDPNYTYTLGASGMAWEAHANPKHPGLMGFSSWSRDIGVTTMTTNPAGPAAWSDHALLNRGVSGDMFAIQ